MTTGIIYAIRNKVSGKRYIGQTTATTAERWRQHIKAARRGSKSPFHCALRAYGPDAWEIDVLYKTDGPPGELDALEQTAIREWRVQDRTFGYNILDGGNTSPAKLPAVRAKIAATLTGHKRSQESIERQVASRLGYHHSEETKRKIREANLLAKVNGVSEEARNRMKASALARNTASYVKAWTPERRAVQSAKLVGHTVAEETRRKISESETGKIESIETRNRKRVASKAARATRFWSTKKKNPEGNISTPL